MRGRPRPGVDVDSVRVRQARIEAGLTLAQVAGDEVSRTFIHLVEHGRSRPSKETLALIAKRTGKPVEYFLARRASGRVPNNEIADDLVRVAGRLQRVAAIERLTATEREAVKFLEVTLKQAARFIRAMQRHADGAAVALIAALAYAN